MASPPGWHTDGDMVRSAYTLRADDDWGQTGTLVREVMKDDERDRLVDNIVGRLLNGVTAPVPERVFDYWRNVDPSWLKSACRVDVGGWGQLHVDPVLSACAWVMLARGVVGPRVDTSEESRPTPGRLPRCCSTGWPPWTRPTGVRWPHLCGVWPRRCPSAPIDPTASGLNLKVPSVVRH